MEMQIREIPKQKEKPVIKERVQETSRERAERIGGMFEEISEEFGVRVVKEITQLIQAGIREGKKPSTSEITSILKHQETRSEFQKYSKDHLERLGILTKNTFDLEKFLNIKAERFFILFQHPFALSRSDYLTNALGDNPVTLQGREHLGLKPLLYTPKHTSEAFDIKKIATTNFHLGFWEIQGWLPEVSTTSPGARENFRALDAAVAAIIYHPKFGNGRRNKQGKLEVLNKKGEYILFSGQWLQEQQGMEFHDPETKTIALDRPLYFLKKYAPTLFEKGLLRSQDFSSRKIEQLEEQARVTEKGQVRLESVRYSLGSEFGGKNIRIDQINEGIAAIVALDENNIGTPIRTFRTFDRDDARVQRRGVENSFTYDVSKADTDVRDFNPQELVKGRSIEERVRILKDFEIYQKNLRLDNALKQAEAPALRSLPPKLFKTLSHSPLIAEQSRHVEAAVEKSGSFALEAAARLAHDKDFLVPTMEVFESLNEEHEPVADILLRTIGEREDLLETLNSAILTGKIDDQVARKMRFEINTQFGAILTVCRQKNHNEAKGGDLESLLATLKTHQQGLALFGKIFRDAFKGSATNLRELPDIQLESKKATDLTRDDKTGMEAIARENWNAQKPEMTELVLQGLRKAFNASGTRFFEIKKNGMLMAFMRFDERLDGSLYAASLNVNNEIRGSGIGDSIMKTVIDMAAEGHVIFTDVFAELPVGTKYVEEYKGVIIGVESVTGSNGLKQKRFILRRDDERNGFYEGKTHHDLQRHSAQLQIVRFDMTKGVEEITSEVERRVQRGFVGTRYFSDPLNPKVRYIAFEPEVRTSQEANPSAQTSSRENQTSVAPKKQSRGRQ
ncbi:MAG: hypothetical protein WCT28_03505 [Patescibacteria group bacterium]